MLVGPNNFFSEVSRGLDQFPQADSRSATWIDDGVAKNLSGSMKKLNSSSAISEMLFESITNDP
jgi:hypothetical protein